MSKSWKLFIVNAVFFGLFLIAFLYETTIPSSDLQYLDSSVIFIPAYVLYIVFYGIFSFLYTKKIILPMRRTLKDSFLKVRALRARELREVWLLSFFLPFFYFISVHSTITPSLSTIIVET